MSDLSADLASLRIDRSESKSRSGAARILAIVLGLGVLLGVGTFALLPSLEAKVFKIEVAVTEISKVSPAQGAIDLTATGYVVAERVAKVTGDIAGRIVRVHVVEGQTVKAGDLLFEVDVADQRASAATLASRASAARARVTAQEAQVVDLERQYQREKTLADQGAALKAQSDDLAGRIKLAEETVKATRAEAAAAEADARALSTTLRHGKISATIDGIVVGRAPQPGDFVSVMSIAPLFEIVDVSSLVIETDVPEARLTLAKPGAPAEVVLDSQPDKRIRAEVKEITPRVNRSKATVVVKVKLLDKVTPLLPDMGARVSFLSKAIDEESIKQKPKIVVPANAIVDRNGEKSVFVIDNGKVQLRPIKLGSAFQDGFELVEGPPPGTRIIKAPAPTLSDGKAVKEIAEK